MNTIDSSEFQIQEFIENSEVMQGLVDDLQAQVARVMQAAASVTSVIKPGSCWCVIALMRD